MRILSISKTYDGKKVLDLHEMEIQHGKIYTIIGANGSGKSTMAKLLSGTEKPDRGPIFDEKYNIGYMPQKSYAFSMSLRKNVLLNGTDELLADEMINMIKLSELSQKNAQKLSGGETARMALIRLMMREYDIIVLDEPTASMDIESTLIAEKMIASYKDRTDAAVVLITHSISQAKRMADVIIFMADGKAVEIGDTEQILRQPKDDRTREFLEFYGAEF